MKRLLVSGCSRSGTTLLAHLLNEQEGCTVHSDVLKPMFECITSLGLWSLTQPLTCREKDLLLSSIKAQGIGRKMDNFRDMKPDFRDARGLYYRALDCLAQPGDEIVGTKVTMIAPSLQMVIGETDVKILYIYRDLRDVLLSSKHRFPHYDFARFLIQWEEEVSAALQVNSDRMFVVKFEDLIGRPERVVGDIAKFLGCEVLTDIKRLDNSSFSDIALPLDPRACYRWLRDSDKPDVECADILKWRMLRELGYIATRRGYGARMIATAYALYWKGRFLNWLLSVAKRIMRGR